MIFEFCYESKEKKIINTIKLFALNFILDFIKVLFINIPVFLIIFFFFSIVRDLFSLQVDFDYSTVGYIVILCIIIIELVAICISEYRQRQLYVFVRFDGITIHNRSYENFGVNQRPKRKTFIPYSRILSCYSAIPYNIEKNAWFMYKNTFDDVNNFFKQTIGVRHIMNAPLVLPAINGGRYDEECVMLELDNNITVALPINECGQFLEIFQKYSSYS